MIFESDEGTCEKHCRVALWVTKIGIHGDPYIFFYFLHEILCPEHTNQLKQLPISHFSIFVKDGRSWLGIVTSPQSNLWLHANARYRHNGVRFVGCSCTRKLTQMWSSLVSNNREYRFPDTRFLRFSVWENIIIYQPLRKYGVWWVMWCVRGMSFGI